jgi:hypothetical protein
MIIEVTPDEIREIYRKIYTGENPHGHFLTGFAQAIVHADEENFHILAAAAVGLLLKYKLHETDSVDEGILESDSSHAS